MRNRFGNRANRSAPDFLQVRCPGPGGGSLDRLGQHRNGGGPITTSRLPEPHAGDRPLTHPAHSIERRRGAGGSVLSFVVPSHLEERITAQARLRAIATSDEVRRMHEELERFYRTQLVAALTVDRLSTLF